MRFTLFSVLLASGSFVLADPSISSFPNSLTLSGSFDPIKAAYWTGLPHHRRTPFSVSPDGKSAYLAYLDSTYKKVVVQQVDTSTFAAVGTPVSIAGYEAAGLVAQNDGFALMATVDATGTTDLPATGTPIVSLIRYKSGTEAWRQPLNGPGIHASDGLTASPDANGDLVYSEKSGLYGAYFVVTAYTGWAAGHFGDSIQYVDDSGALQTTTSSSTFGCSHNTGIGIEAADAVPFATICAEDQGSIWLNTDTQYMSGVKIANENTTNGVSGEPMGGMSGSYSNLALFPGTTKYIFGWQSRGALDLTTNAWLGSPYTQCSPRWLNHNVAITTMTSKNKLSGAEASSTVGAKEGDSQVNWITYSDTDDHQNVHVAALSSDLSLVTYETLTSPKCEPVPLSCSGTYAGTSFQFVDSAGAKVGAATVSKNVFVSGDIAVVGDKLCWPYVDMTWDLSQPKSSGTPVTKMSFACASSGGSSGVVSSVVASSSSAAAAATAPIATSLAQGNVVSSTSSKEVPLQTASAPAVSTTESLIPISSTPIAKASTAPLQPSPGAEISTTESLIPVTPIKDSTSANAGVATSTSTIIAAPISSSARPTSTVTVTRSRFGGGRPTTFRTRTRPTPSAVPVEEEETCEAD